MTDEGRRGVGAVSNHVTEAMAMVTLGKGGAGGKFAGTNIGAKDCRWLPAYNLKAHAVWVIKGPHNATTMATVSDIACRAAEPSQWGEGLVTFAHRGFHEFCLEGRGGREVSVIVMETWDTVEHNSGEALIGDAMAVRSQISEQDGVIFRNGVHIELTLKHKHKIMAT
jgi:hypothetical protein